MLNWIVWNRNVYLYKMDLALIFHQIHIDLFCGEVLWHSRRIFSHPFICNWRSYVLRRWGFFSRWSVICGWYFSSSFSKSNVECISLPFSPMHVSRIKLFTPSYPSLCKVVCIFKVSKLFVVSSVEGFPSLYYIYIYIYIYILVE